MVEYFSDSLILQSNGQLSEYKEVRNELKDILLQRLINRKNLVTFNEERILKQRDDSSEGGVMIGVW
jgi:hypothetical protein